MESQQCQLESAKLFFRASSGAKLKLLAEQLDTFVREKIRPFDRTFLYGTGGTHLMFHEILNDLVSEKSCLCIFYISSDNI